MALIAESASDVANASDESREADSRDESPGVERELIGSTFPPAQTIPESQWKKARARLEAIRPVFEAGRPFLPHLREASKISGYSVAALYRYLERYLPTRDTRSLLDRGKGQSRRSRLIPAVLSIIQEQCQNRFLSSQRLKISEICLGVQAECWRQNLPRPHANTIRNHIARLKAQLGNRSVESRRGNKKVAEATYTPRHGTFNAQDRPAERFEIDHTKIDVILVDEEDRREVGRAFITVALDLATRMIAGFYISKTFLSPPIQESPQFDRKQTIDRMSPSDSTERLRASCMFQGVGMKHNGVLSLGVICDSERSPRRSYKLLAKPTS